MPGDAGAPRGVNVVVTDAPKAAPPRDVTRTVYDTPFVNPSMLAVRAVV